MSHTNKWIIFICILYYFTKLVDCAHDPSRSYCISELKYCNPKYVLNCSVVSYREKINGVVRSLTDINATSLYTVGNNVTFSLSYTSEKGFRYKPEHKFCDLFTHPWMQHYISLYQKDAKIPCPFPPGLFQLKKLEMPLQNSPMPLVPGLYTQDTQVFQTKTKERIVTIHYTVFLAGKKKTGKKKGITGDLS